MPEVLAWVIGTIQQRLLNYADYAIALASHADLMKDVLLHPFHIPIDVYDRREIFPASISTLVARDWGSKILCLNKVIAT
jgi:hypothetical protein